MPEPKKGMYGTAKIIGDSANPTPDVESSVGHEPLGASEITAFDSPVCVTIVSYRTHLADADGISAKAAIDGLVLARVIRDDGPAYVEEVRYRQIKVQTTAEERTVIEIETVASLGR